MGLQLYSVQWFLHRCDSLMRCGQRNHDFLCLMWILLYDVCVCVCVCVCLCV